MNTDDLYTFFDERKQAVTADIQELAAEGRTDEANILKAKCNVYDIAGAVLGATLKQSPASVGTAFPVAFDRITSGWRLSLEQARSHGDDRKVLIEEAKLSAVSEINARFAEPN